MREREGVSAEATAGFETCSGPAAEKAEAAAGIRLTAAAALAVVVAALAGGSEAQLAVVVGSDGDTLVASSSSSGPACKLVASAGASAAGGYNGTAVLAGVVGVVFPSAPVAHPQQLGDCRREGWEYRHSWAEVWVLARLGGAAVSRGSSLSGAGAGGRPATTVSRCPVAEG